jgi:hypothetical protein
MPESLTPELLPEIEGAEFIRSDDVADIAREVLSEHGTVGGVVDAFETARAIADEEIHVLWLLNTKPFDEAKEERSHDAAGKCIKAPRMWADVTGYDVAIWIREHYWLEADDRVKRAMLLHELLHVEIRRDKNDVAKVAVRKHDIEDFVAVAKHYGPIFGYGNGGAPAYVRAAEVWERRTSRRDADDQHASARASDDEDLRPKGEVNADALRGVVERAARKLGDLAEDSGTTMTIRSGDREATIGPRNGRRHNGGAQPPVTH